MRLCLVPDIHRATHQIGLYLQAALAGEDVNQAEAHVLAQLHEEGACAVARVQTSFGHKPSTLTSILNRLEKKGLIVREHSAKDRRSLVVRPTARGKAVARRVHGALLALEARVLRVKTRRAHLAAVHGVLGDIQLAALAGIEEAMR